MAKKQYFLVEVTVRYTDYPCTRKGHAADIKSNLLDHDDVKSVKVRGYKPPITKSKGENTN